MRGSASRRALTHAIPPVSEGGRERRDTPAVLAEARGVVRTGFSPRAMQGPDGGTSSCCRARYAGPDAGSDTALDEASRPGGIMSGE